MLYKNRLPYSTPESQGIASNTIRNFVHRVDRQIESFHSFMLLRHGRVVADGWWHPYKPEMPHMLFSLSKSYTSTAIGMAESEGLLSVDDPVLRFFPADAPANPSDNLKAMRVHHLLCMSTGHASDTTGAMMDAPDSNWAKAFLNLPLENPPGAPFVYNTGATYMLSAIIQNITGSPLVEYLRPRLFEPLGIENPIWETCPRGINTGGFGLSVTTPDIAKLGQLYLQRGLWEGRQLLPTPWVETASFPHAQNDHMGTPDWKQGYGYQFWRCQHNAYRGDGAFGQYCIIMPEQDAVLAITSGVKDMQAVLDVVWQCLVPNMYQRALAENPQAYAALQDLCANLRLTPLQHTQPSALAQSLSGKRYAIPTNELEIDSVVYDFTDSLPIMTLFDKHGANAITLGDGEWHNQLGRGRDNVAQPIAASGTWANDATHVAKIIFTHTPFVSTITSAFAGNQVTVTIVMNVGFGPTQAPPLIGVAQE